MSSFPKLDLTPFHKNLDKLWEHAYQSPEQKDDIKNHQAFFDTFRYKPPGELLLRRFEDLKVEEKS